MTIKTQLTTVEDFSRSAERAHFAIEGGGEVPVLRAELVNENGQLEFRDVNLSERIENHDGRFVYRELHGRQPAVRKVSRGRLLTIF